MNALELLVSRSQNSLVIAQLARLKLTIKSQKKDLDDARKAIEEAKNELDPFYKLEYQGTGIIRAANALKYYLASHPKAGAE
jgi:hypothetical protein